MDKYTQYELLCNKLLSYANMKLKFTPKTIIEEVKMCTVKITIIMTYKVIKQW